MRRVIDISLYFRVDHVRGEAPGAHLRINFEDHGKDHVAQMQGRPARRVVRFANVSGKFGKQAEKKSLFRGLAFVVGRPVLSVLRTANIYYVAFLCQALANLNGVDMFAGLAVKGEVRASAGVLLRVHFISGLPV